jgi:CheY-like chemotaxis protein
VVSQLSSKGTSTTGPQVDRRDIVSTAAAAVPVVSHGLPDSDTLVRQLCAEAMESAASALSNQVPQSQPTGAASDLELDRKTTCTGAYTMPRRRVLVVDDKVDCRTSLAMVVRALGHEVEMSHDGEHAIQVTEQFQPDTILLDIGLPKLNGWDVARTLRAKYGPDRLLLVAVTGYGSEGDRKHSRQVGFDRHFVKPLDIDDLRSVLDR